MKKYFWLMLVGIIGLQIFLLIKIKFTAWPEMTLWPYLVTKGWLPYRDIAIAHNPLLILDLSIFYKLFGVGIIQLKIFTWVLIGLTDVLIYWVTKKLWNRKVALIALAAFAIWQMFYEGDGLWFDLYMGVFAFISFYFAKSKNWFWTGLFWALAFISKQTAVWFLIPIGLELVQSTQYTVPRFKEFIVGVLFVIVPSILVLWFLGILPDFYRWAINFGIFVLPKAIGQVQLPNIKTLTISVFPFLIFIPLIWKPKMRNLGLIFWAIAGGLGVFPRFEYFHLQPAIPFLAIASGVVFSEIKTIKRYLKIFMVLYILGSLYLFSGYLIRNFKGDVRFYESDVQDVVSYVKSNTKPGDKIFVMNWWDNIYALSDRLPVVDPWVPQLEWYMELPGIQEKMVENLKSSMPKLIILNSYTENGLSAYVPQKVFNYITANYKFKEKVDSIEIFIPKPK